MLAIFFFEGKPSVSWGNRGEKKIYKNISFKKRNFKHNFFSVKIRFFSFKIRNSIFSFPGDSSNLILKESNSSFPG